jgi:hypothetical protein
MTVGSFEVRRFDFLSEFPDGVARAWSHRLGLPAQSGVCDRVRSWPRWWVGCRPQGAEPDAWGSGGCDSGVWDLCLRSAANSTQKKFHACVSNATGVGGLVGANVTPTTHQIPGRRCSSGLQYTTRRRFLHGLVARWVFDRLGRRNEPERQCPGPRQHRQRDIRRPRDQLRGRLRAAAS